MSRRHMRDTKGGEDMGEQIRFTLRIVDELNQLLESRAKKLGVTKHALILQILWAYIEGGTDNERR